MYLTAAVSDFGVKTYKKVEFCNSHISKQRYLISYSEILASTVVTEKNRQIRGLRYLPTYDMLNLELF